MKSLYSGAVLVVIVALTSGCMTQGGRMRGGAPTDGSVVAAIDGIADSDRQRQGVTYELICDQGGKVVGKIAGDYVRFAGDKIADKDLCAMEVRAPITDDTGYEWFGVENGAKAKGLLYGSNKAEVAARKLSLTLYKLYSFNQNDFLAKVQIAFAAEAAVPATAKSSGTLVCDDGKSYGGAYAKATGERDATLIFPLKVTDVKDKACTKIVVNVDNVATFAAATPDITFPDPKKNVAQTFPVVAGTRYTVTAIPTGGDVDVDIVNGGLCLNFEGTVCKDRRTVDLPFAKNIFVAKIVGRHNGGDGETVSFYVAAGPSGFGAFDGKTLKVTDINTTLKDGANDAEKTRFNFYRDTVSADLFSPTFDADFVAGTRHATHKVERSEVADVVFLHLDRVYLHGFHPVEEVALNALTAANWLALVKAKKDGNADIDFVVTGKDKYFRSASAPISSPATDYFDYPALVADMTGTGSDRWRLYALKGGAMSEAACDIDQTYYVDEGSIRHVGQLAATDAKLDACEILKEHFRGELSTYTASVTFMLWDWYSLVGN